MKENISFVKRLASDILGVGISRIRVRQALSDEEQNRLSGAMGREEVRSLIKDKIVFALPKKGRRKNKAEKRQGVGKRKGKKYSRLGRKDQWMMKVRAQRRYLRQLVSSGEMNSSFKRKVYLMIKGGYFKSKAALRHYLEDNNMLISKGESR